MAMPVWTPEWSPKLDRVKNDVLTFIGAGTGFASVTLEQIEEGFELSGEEVWIIVERLWEEGRAVCTDGRAFWRGKSDSVGDDT